MQVEEGRDVGALGSYGVLWLDRADDFGDARVREFPRDDPSGE